MSIVQGGTYTYEHKGEAINVNDKIIYSPAVCESIALDAYVARTNTDLLSGDSVATCTRALKVLTADAITGTGNMTRALDIVTCATATSAKVIKVGDIIYIGSDLAGTVIELIDNTNVRVNASGTIGASTWTYQRALFKDVYPGATLVLATGTTTVLVESKTSDYVVVTTTSGTITTGLLTSYKNVESLINYKSDDSKGTIYGVAMESFAVTSATAYAASDMKVIPVKWFGDYDKNKATTSDYATAGTVPEAIHRKAVRLVHNPIIRQY
jgi:hypothetical protein